MAKTQSKVRCAVIGLGMGRGHADGYMQCPDAQLVAVADIDAARVAPWREKVGEGGCFTDYRAMLKQAKPDLVSVALPNALHAPVTIDCLKAGCHVLCEKPMAMNVREALAMQREAQKRRRKLGINLSFRFTPAARALKDLADDGFLGEVYHARTQWTRRDGFPKFGGWFGQKNLSGGGPLIDLGVHRIDLAMWLMGSPAPVTVSAATHHKVGIPRAKAAGLKFDVEDFAAGFVRFDNGASLVLEISWAGHQATQELMITSVTGTKGTLVHRNDAQGQYNFLAEMFWEHRGHKLAGTLAVPRRELPSSYADMVRAVVKNTDPLATAEDGIRIQRVLDGLYRSAKIGREISV